MNPLPAYIIIDNDKQEIKKTNYLATDYNRGGFFYLFLNARAFRLLVPDAHVEEITRESALAKSITITREPSRMFILFDDDSDTPFSIDLDLKQMDILPVMTDSGRECLFTAWARGPNETMKKIFEMKCKYIDTR